MGGLPPTDLRSRPTARRLGGMGLLENQVALVTGASQGIGGAIAEELSRSGAIVGLLAGRAEVLGEVARGLAGRSFVVGCDLETDEEVGRVSERVEAAVGRGVDVLV